MKVWLIRGFAIMMVFSLAAASRAAEIRSAGQPARLDIRAGGDHSVRITLKPISFQPEFPFSPSIVERRWPSPAISLRDISAPVTRRVGGLQVTVRPDPLTVVIATAGGDPITDLTFDPESGQVSFKESDRPILGMGEGGPRMDPKTWRQDPLEFDRRGRLHEMVPRWQAQAYGSRNPVAMLISTAGWGLFVATPWVQVDLKSAERGVFIPWKPPVPDPANQRTFTAQVQGRPPVDGIVPGVFDVFVFDAHDPAAFMKDVSLLTGPAVMPPKWSLGYMQSHRTLEDETQMIRDRRYLPREEDPARLGHLSRHRFLPARLEHGAAVVRLQPGGLQARSARDDLRTCTRATSRSSCTSCPGRATRAADAPRDDPAGPGGTDGRDAHPELLEAACAARRSRHRRLLAGRGRLVQPLRAHQAASAVLPGAALDAPQRAPVEPAPQRLSWESRSWGGWVWSGDTDSSWKHARRPDSVGLNHSLSLSPYWGSDIGGFYPNAS